MDKKLVATFFDFDGIWFRPDVNWQVKNIHLGSLGSSISWHQACRSLELAGKKNPGLSVEDHYSLPSLCWDTVPYENSHNITPPENLWKMAEKHRSQGHDLYVISQASCPSLLRRMNLQAPELYNKKIKTNPFHDIHFICDSLIEKENADEATLAYIQLKITKLFGFLRGQAVNGLAYNYSPNLENPPQRKVYDQIFLYYTQSQYQPKISQILNEYQNHLTSRRMAIVASYIAQVNGKEASEYYGNYTA